MGNTLLIVLLVVLSVFIVLLVTLGTIFIVALRKRAPIIKVVMAPPAARDATDEAEEEEEDEEPEQAPAAPADETPKADDAPAAPIEPKPAPEKPRTVDADEDDGDDDESETSYVVEGQERVRYDRSFTAKVCQLRNEIKNWYSELKNELLAYERVKDRMSWKRETFRMGKMTVARLVVRGKTLCLMLAVEPAGYAGTRYTVEDVSNVAATADTPTLYRIKSVRRLKYAKEMIAGIMKELKVYKDPRYEAKDYFIPYEGDMALMQRGLVKRVVSASTRVFKIEEVDKLPEQEAAAATDEKPVGTDADGNK